MTVASPTVALPSAGYAPDFRLAACAHCGLPVPAEQSEPSSERQFCCAGCRMAYGVIQSAGLGAYYLEREREVESERAGARALRAPAASYASYASYDDPTFQKSHVVAENGLARVELFVEGIHCSACVWLIERLPRVVPGVTEARLDMSRGALAVSFEPAQVKLSQIAKALHGLGYPVHPAATARDNGDVARDRSLLLRLGIAGACAGNVMLMALALYSGALSGMEHEFLALFRWGSFALTLPAVLFSASVFFRGALAAIRTRTPHMDLPVSIGILAGFGRSAWNTIFGSGEIYFDSIAVLIFLLLIGRWLQQRHHRRAARTAELIGALAPASAHRLSGDVVEETLPEALCQGDRVEIRANERIPVDGVVLSGSSSVDASWLTGESMPEDVASGARVHAGTKNLSGTLLVRVEASGAQTRLGRLLESVAQAQQKRAPIVRLADHVAGYFVIAVLALSLVTLLIWLRLDPSRAVDNAIALLVVTCPCALGMATPLAVSAALRRAAGSGIFFRGGEFLEVMARPASIVFDKTGTLTEGRLVLYSFSGDASIKPLVRAAESRSAHPIARALVAALEGGPELCAQDVVEQVGGGVDARVDGRSVLVGSKGFMQGAGVQLEDEWRSELDAHAAAGRPAILVAVDGHVRAIAAFNDALRADAAASVEALRDLGYDIALLSGDQPLVVEKIASKLGVLVAAKGGMSPEEKLAWVESARRKGRVVMVGDGVNDAAAMSAADVGIAVHGGAEASLAAADVFTTQPGVAKVLEAAVGARRTLRVIRRGIAFSLGYNVIGVGLALTGTISPLIAAILMPLSSITVVSSALRSKTFTHSTRKTPTL